MNRAALKAAGFTDDEINQHASAQASKLQAAGFSQEEIRKHLDKGAIGGYNAAVAQNDIVPFVEGIANKAIDMVGMVPAGIRGLAEAVIPGGMTGMEGLESTMEYVREKVPRFTGDKVKLAEQSLEEQWEQKVNVPGRAIGAFATKYGALSGPAYLLANEQQRGKMLAAGETLGEIGANVVVDPLAPGAVMLGARSRRPAQTSTVPATEDLTFTKALEVLKNKGIENPTPTQILQTVEVLEASKDPRYVQYTGPEVTAPEAPPVRAEPLAEVPALDMPERMAVEPTASADLRAVLGPAVPSLRSRVEPTIEVPRTDVTHLDPIELAAQREAPEAGALLEDTAPFQPELDFQGKPDFQPSVKIEDIRRRAAAFEAAAAEALARGDKTNRAELAAKAWDLNRQADALEASKGTEVRLTPRTPEGLYSMETGRATPEYPAGDKVPLQPELPLNKPYPDEGVRSPSMSVGDLSPLNLNPKLGEFVTRNDVQGGLEHIVSTSESTFNKVLARAIQRLLGEDFRPNLILKDFITEADLGAPIKEGHVYKALYDSREGIKFSSASKGHLSENTFLHEVIHAAIARIIDLEKYGKPVPKKLADFTRNLNNLFEYVKSQHPDKVGKMYGFTDLHEFISEAFSTPGFRQLLQDTRIRPDIQRNLYKFVKTVWDALTASFMRAVGLPVTQKNITAFQGLIDQTIGMMRTIGADPELRRQAFGPEAQRQNVLRTGSLDETLKMVSKAPDRKPQSFAEYKETLAGTTDKVILDRFAPALYKQYMEQWKKDNSPIPNPTGYYNPTQEQFKKDLFRTDGTQRIDDIPHVSLMGTGYHQGNKHLVVRRVYDAISQASVKRDNLFNQLFHDARIEDRGFNPLRGKFTGLSRAKRAESPDSLAAQLQRSKDVDGASIMEVVNKYKDTNPEYLTDPVMLKANDLSPRAIKLMRTLNEKNVQALNQLNATRKSRGLDAVSVKEGWFWSHVRYGAYQVFGVDSKTGSHSFLAGFNNFADAQKVADSLKSRGITVYAAPARNNPKNASIVPGDAFLAAQQLLPDPESRRLMREATEAAIQRMGVGKHALARDSKAGGFAGSTEIVDALGAGKAWDGVKGSIETYFQQVANYVGAADAAKAVAETLSDADIKRDYPNARSVAEHMWDQFKGKDRLGDAEQRTLSTKLGTLPVLRNFVNDRTGAKVLTGSANMFVNTQLLWWNPVFYLANATQHVLMPPKMLQLNQTTLGGKGNVALAALRGQKHLLWPDEESKRILQTALENGSIEPRFVEALDWTASRNPVLQNVKTVMGEKVAGVADSFARASAYAQMYELGKSAGLKDAEAHSFAARESQGTMMQYERWARMPVLNKMGVVGDIMAPLTTYVTNFAYQIADYIKQATVGGTEGKRLIAPLITLLGAQVAMAGIKGSPAYEDLENVWLLLNKAYMDRFRGEPLPMPAEFIADLELPGVVEHGVFSHLSGVDMSSTLGSGAIFSNLGQIAGVSYAGNLLAALYDEVMAAATGTPLTTDEKLRIARLAPGASKEFLKSYLQGKSPLEPADVLSKGGVIYQRNEREQLGSLLTGRSSINESKTKDAMYQSNELLASATASKTAARDLIVDAFLNGRDIPPMAERVLERYPEILDGISDAISKKLDKLSITEYQRKLEQYKNDPYMLDILQRSYANVKQ